MAIQNVFAKLADPKTMQDFQKEMIEQELAKQQLANAQLQNKASNISVNEAIRKQDLINQDKNLALQNVITDEQGNKSFNTKGYLNSRYSLDPKGTFDLVQQDAKTQKDLKVAGLEEQIKNLDVTKKTIENNRSFIEGAIQDLNGVQTPDQLEQIKQKHIAIGDQLGIKNNIASWTFDQIPNLMAQGLTTKDKLASDQKRLDDLIERKQREFDNNFKAQEFSLKNQQAQREQAKFNREQAGILTPKDEQEAIKELRSQRLAQKNTIKIDEKESALAGLSSFFEKDKNGKPKYKYENDKGVGTYDLRLIVAAIKADDPTSTVSENEVRSATGTESWFGQLERDLQYRILNRSFKLNNDQRLALFNNANAKIAEQRKVLQDLDTPFINQIKEYGLPADKIFTPAEIKRYGLDNDNTPVIKQDRRNNPLGGLPNAPQPPNNPFSKNADVPPPPYTGIADTNGNVQILGNNNPKPLVPNLANKKFTALPLEDRQKIQLRAKQLGISPQEYYSGLQRFNQ